MRRSRRASTEYERLGARFAQWRAVIGAGIPSPYCLDTNAHALARYAALCKEVGLVPIVEPEALMDGDHSIERCFEVTEATLHRVFGALWDQRVVLEQLLLSSSWPPERKTMPGTAAGTVRRKQSTVARATSATR